jgi:SAM-dependent methyltransferase
MNKKNLEGALSKYNFYHIIKLDEGIFTPGYEHFVPVQQMVHKALQDIPLQGKRVLDVGCRDGLFSFEAEKMGAREVIGIDNDLSAAAVDFLIPYFGSKVKMYELNIYDLKPETFGKFDVVIFPGVLYHLKYPFWALKRIRDVMTDDGQLIIETAVLDAHNRYALLYCPSEAESPYGATSSTFFNAKGLKDALYSMGITVRDVRYFLRDRAIGHSPDPLRLLGYRLYNFAANVKQRFVRGDRPPRGRMGPIDRATFVCDVTLDTINQEDLAYWEHTHRWHSTDSSGREPLDAIRRSGFRPTE